MLWHTVAYLVKVSQGSLGGEWRLKIILGDVPLSQRFFPFEGRFDHP